MFKRGLTIFLIGLAAFSANAENPPVVTLSELRQLAYDGEVKAVSAALKQAQDVYLSGEISADYMRTLFSGFQTTDRRMIAFINKWLEDDPTGAMPNIARFWSISSAADGLIGTSFASDLHRDAFSAYRFLLSEAGRRVRLAFEEDPDLIPVSDGALKLVAITGVMDQPGVFVDRIMEMRPNWGTLHRVLFLANPAYNGSVEMLDRICERYGPMVPTDGVDMVFRCKFVGRYEDFNDESFDWLVSKVDEDDDRYLDFYRAKFIITMAHDGLASDKQMRFARRIMSEPTRINLNLAMRYNAFIAQPNGWPKIDRQVILQARAHAREALKHDPYNHDLIDMALLDWAPAGDQKRSKRKHEKLPDPIDAATRIEYARRKLVTRPHDPHLWSDYAGQLTGRGTPDAFLAGDPYLENAAYYSGHDAGFLSSIMARKLLQYQAVEAAATMEISDVWKDFFADLDVEYHIYCPYLRAYRQQQALCDTGGAEMEMLCDMGPQFTEPMEALARLAANTDSCDFAATAPLSRLRYDPIGLPLSAVPGG
ncbi:hypothetical protein ACOTTU_05185 [Roseobacter sp. EG26]|uniref:hypothetical protein n=1 Tax=Roseobacter sp. EG26 TaxID=3412477 RepID=UPI003CE45E34